MTVEEKIEKISKKISSKILFDYNLKKLNWFNLGGSAKVFFKPDNLNDLVLFLKEFSSNLPIKVIGAGSNILVRDGGFNGVIIKLGKNFSHLSKLDNGTIVSGASVLDKKLSDSQVERLWTNDLIAEVNNFDKEEVIRRAKNFDIDKELKKYRALLKKYKQ